MARPRDVRVEHALRDAAAAVACEGDGTWRVSLVHGAAVTARALASDGWLELKAPMPDRARATHDDLSWLRFNACLDGSARAARSVGSRALHLKVDTHVEHEPDLAGRIASACHALSEALRSAEDWPGDRAPLPFEEPRTAAAEIQRVGVEAGWPCVVVDGTGVRLSIETRAGVCAARIESSPTGAERAVVEVSDIAGQSIVSRRAQAALLMAVSASVRSVKAILRHRDGGARAALVAPLDGPIDTALDRALSALAVACHISGREVQALRDERLAADYLALWDAAYPHESHNRMEDETCLQQL